jgi:hypothetical protein
MRAGQLPPKDESGKTFLKVPVNGLWQERNPWTSSTPNPDISEIEILLNPVMHA